ncbi:sigma-70 family RNA polymerase sigma factor [Aquisphaera insulae]|uniref:sigma-70 family RNA polymerase sigma factor n=1 Tax=Aquisphaera insulae TaxID=2712864 RepID=UPI0013EB3F23|nr:sigma-70 family RNA polymerase sigma factor [Aquisphaera insulae]
MSEATQATQDLLERAGHGDHDARRALLGLYRDRLLRMVSARLDTRVAPRVDASDVVQETLADAADRMDDYLRERPLPFFGWLRSLAGERVIQAHRRHLYTQQRSVARESRLPDLSDVSTLAFCRQLVAADTSPSNRMSRQEEVERVREALAALSPRDREVLIMRHFEQLGTAEIAEALGLAESGVKSRLLRALARIRSVMEIDA